MGWRTRRKDGRKSGKRKQKDDSDRVDGLWDKEGWMGDEKDVED